jgi:hypothetical protein
MLDDSCKQLEIRHLSQDPNVTMGCIVVNEVDVTPVHSVVFKILTKKSVIIHIIMISTIVVVIVVQMKAIQSTLRTMISDNLILTCECMNG